VIASRDGRPLLFLDVDGPLIPFRARPAGRLLASSGTIAFAAEPGNPLVDRLDPEDGRRLLALGCELVWATTWMADANEVVAPRLGLPQLSVVEFPDEDEIQTRGLHWKTKFLTEWAGGRTFVWLDDEISDTDRRWVDANHQGGAFLHRVDPLSGLTDADFALIRDWLAAR
jgi:Swiss Army Knife RNA repair-like protein